MRKWQRILSVFLGILLLVGAFPAGGIVFNASALRLEVERDYTVGQQLDYAVLFEKALVVIPGLDGTGNINYSYRGRPVSEQYSPTRHFASFAEAAASVGDSADTPPVFYLAAGEYSGAQSVPAGSVILGANAGITPNGYINFDLPDVTKGWSAADRFDETVVLGAVVSDGDVVIDGVSYTGSGSLFISTDADPSARSEFKVTVQNSLISNISGNAAFFDTSASVSDAYGYDIKDTRITNTSSVSPYYHNTYAIHTDGVYFYNNTGTFVNCEGGFSEYNISIDIYRSYMYKNTADTYGINVPYTSGDHKSRISIDSFLWYESTDLDYGFIRFYTTPDSKFSSYNIDIINSTFVADNSFVDSYSYTIMNGNQTYYQLGTYTINFNNNRVIGFESMFPNVSDQAGTHKVHCDFNNNYFAPEFTAVTDVLGTRSYYANHKDVSHGSNGFNNIDYARIDLLNYYTDYAMTLSDKTFDINGISFYDNVDYVSIDNTNDLVNVGMREGTVTSPEVYFENDAVSSKIYTDSACTNECTTFSAPPRGVVATYYISAECSGTEKVIPLYVYGEEAVPNFSDSYSDSAGRIKNTAYLLCKETDSGDIEAEFDGDSYLFTVGKNAFSSVEKIIAACDGVPQIILPYGEYSDIIINGDCEIYGQNRRSPVYTSLSSECVSGVDWISGKSAKLSGVEVRSGNVVFAGVEFADDVAVADGADITVRNSKVHALDFGGGITAVDMYGCEVLSDILLTGALPANVDIEACIFNDGRKVTESRWSIESYDSACSFSVVGCLFDGADSTVLSNIRIGDATESSDFSFALRDNIFNMVDTSSPAFVIKPAAYNTVSVTGNRFVADSDSGSPIYFDNTVEARSVEFTNNRFVGFEKIDTATDKYPIDGSYNYFAKYTEDYKSAQNGTAIPGNIYCSDYYIDYTLTNTVPSVTGFEFSDGITVSGRKLTLSVSEDVTDVSRYINAECGIMVTDTDGNVCDIVALSSEYDLSVYNVIFFNTVSPCCRIEYQLSLVRKVPAGCKIISVTSSVAHIEKNENGIYTMTLPASVSDADITVNTDGGTAGIYFEGSVADGIKGVPEGTYRDYEIVVSDADSSARYRLRVTRPISSGVIIDYDGAVDTAYIIGADKAGGNISFYYRGSTVTRAYDASKHFDTFEAAYSAYLATDPDIIYDTPVFIFAPGDYGSITVNYRAVILGANAGIKPMSTTAPGSRPFDTPVKNSARSDRNATTFLGSIVRPDGDSLLEQAEKDTDTRLELYTVIDGIDIMSPDSFIAESGERRHSLYIQNTVSASPVASGGGKGSVTLKNIKAGGIASPVASIATDSLTVDDSYIYAVTADSLFTGVAADIRIENSFVVADNSSIGINVSGKATLKSNIISAKGVTVSGAQENIFVENTLTGGSLTVAEGVSVNIEDNRFIGCGNVDADSIGVNYFAPNYSGDGDTAGMPLGDDWYIDYKLTLRRSDFNVIGVSFASGIHTADIDNSIPYIEITLTDDSAQSATFIAKGANVVAGLTLDGAPVSQIEAGNTYKLLLSMGGYIHTVTIAVSYESAVFFTDTDGVGDIKNTAVMISPDIIADDGDGRVIEWRGEKYKFIYGQNLFKTMDEARAALDGHIQMMLPAYDFEEAIVMPVDTSLYGVNFDVDPNVKSEIPGDDWARNPEWGKYGHTEICNISVPYEATGTLVEMYGITLRGRIYDGDRISNAECTEFNIVNTLVEHEDWMDTIYGGTSYMYTITLTNGNSTNGSLNTDRGMIKNMRVEKLRVNPEVALNRNRLLNERLPSDFTVDGLYIDMKKAECSLFGWMKMGNYQKNGKVTFKNCNFRNNMDITTTIWLAFEGRDHAKNADGEVAEMTVTACTFYNMQPANRYGLQISPCCYSKVTVTDNLFLSTSTPKSEFIYLIDLASSSTVLHVDISGNRFVGTRGTTTFSPGTGTLDMSDNYYAAYTSDYRDGVSGSALSGTNISCTSYYKDYALNFKNTDLTPYAFGNGMIADMQNNTLSLSLDAMNGRTMSFGEYVVSNPGGHSIAVSGVSDISAIPLSDGENVFTVTIGGQDIYALTVTLKSLSETLDEVIAEAREIINKDSFSRYTAQSAYDLRTAFNTAEEVNLSSSATDREITDAVYELRAAISALETDVSELDSKIAACPTNSDGKYTAASYAALTAVIEEAGSYIRFTPELVDSLIADIDSAVDGLVDMSAYNQALAAARAYDTSAYSDKIGDAFKTEIENIAAQASIVTKADVIRETERINAAYSMLVVLRGEFKALYARVNSFNASDWTYISFNALIDARDRAASINADSTQAQVDAAAADISTAIDGLVDASAFGNALARARAMTNDGKYSQQSWDGFIARLDEIEYQSRSYLTTQQAREGATEIALAIAGLTADSSVLSEALKRAEDYPRAGYTSASLAVLDVAVKNAKNVKEGADQIEINALADAINSAIDSLVASAPLSSAVSSLDGISNTANIYCPSSYTEFRSKVASLRSRISAVATPAEADIFLAEVNSVKAGLRKHVYVYKNNNDATCKRLATQTGTCSCGARVTKQIPDSLAPHKCNSYTYNNDATYAKDGTKSGKCVWCGVSVTVTAENTQLKVVAIDSSERFVDVKAGAWYKNAVDYTVGAGFISGMSDTKFGVNTEITRGMFITILARIAGVDTSKTANNTSTKFTDVARGKYYTAAIKWAVANGVANGTSTTTFEPDANIQRQQLCVMIVNFAKFRNVTVGAAEPEIAFADAGSVGNYAKAAVKTCQMADIVNGYTEGGKTVFKPSNTATRAEAAQILYKFHSTYVAK